MFPKKRKLIVHILRYTFFLSLFFWVLLSIYVGYQYVLTTAHEVNTKWWTFVEGIFWGTSFLPYLRFDTKSLFYQWLLFNSCLKITYDKEGNHSYVSDMCKVTTQDNIHFSVELIPWFIWSDGTPVSIDDLYFTYNELIRNNKRKLLPLTQYNTIEVTKDTATSLMIKFPTTSPDNKVLFTYYILPVHVLKDKNFQDYKSLYAFSPVYTNCASILPQTKDEFSLIFNLVNCPSSHLNFYQVKNLISFEQFQQNLSYISMNEKNHYLDINATI